MKCQRKTNTSWSFPCRALQTFVWKSFLCFTIYLISPTPTQAQCLGESCEHFKFIINEDVTYNHALQGHVAVTATALSAVKCHLLCRDDCRCISMNYLTTQKENNCQLNDDNQYQKPDSLKPRQGSRYYDLVRQHPTRAGKKYLPGKDKCVGVCCRSGPCLNDGKCQEMCESEGPRFKCVCQPGMGGKYCQLKIRGCKDVWDAGNNVSGLYAIYDLDNNAIPLFCDLESESNFIWTLIQSYSLAKNNDFKSKIIGVNHPVNEDSMKWQKYGLSLPHMQYIAGTSTHFRATCNFHADGLVYRDYARAKLDGLDIFGVWDGKCVMYEFLNIRGIECIHCTAETWQKTGETFHINSYWSQSRRDCSFDGRSAGYVYGEQNFGRYVNQNPAFRCTYADDDTTQFWIGQRKP